MMSPLPLLIKKLREHRTPLRPLDLQGSFRHLVYLTRHKLQVTLLHTEVEKKDTTEEDRERTFTVQRAQQRRIYKDDDASSLGCDLRAPPSAVGTMTFARRPWPSGPRPPRVDLGRWCCDLHAPPMA